MSTFLFGRNAVRESIKAGNVNKLFVSSRLKNDPLAREATGKGIAVAFVSDEELSGLVDNPSHQGFVAEARDFVRYSLADLLQGAKGKKYPLLVLLDGIEDPHNLGAILRDCDAFGVDGVILKSHGEVPLNGTVAKVSAGAVNFVKVATVSNLSQAIAQLKANGYWIVASASAGKDNYAAIDYKSPIGLVVGAEGKGASPLVLRNSDFIVRIPMLGTVNSLNASVATGILLSQIVISRQ